MQLPSIPNINGVCYPVRLGLLVEVRDKVDEVSISLGGDFMSLLRTGAQTLANASGFCRIVFAGEQLDIHERQFGWRSNFVRVRTRDDRELLGAMEFHSELLRSTIVFADHGSSLCIRCPAGESDPYPVRPLGRNMVAFDCLRALDETPPGRFTIRLSDNRRNIEVGCFMARGMVFKR